MDKSWVNLSRTSKEYDVASWNFVLMADTSSGNSGFILCPCKECKNLSHHNLEKVHEHLIIKGMDPTYNKWFHHGELVHSERFEDKNFSDAYDLYRAANLSDDNYEVPLDEADEEEFKRELDEAETPLYDGCTKYTKLSSTVSLFKVKTKNGWSDKGFNELLEIFQDMLPENNALHKSIYDGKKMIKKFDLGCEKIHACVNDCCLFRKEYELLENCPTCGASRWKVDERSKKVHKGVPAKVLRYFPIKPRFNRIFRSPKMAKSLVWHATNKSTDGKMRHPVDSSSWESIDLKWTDFSDEPRNLRLGLATDGFNPFSIQSSTYSCWPVMLVIYNLPPWLCMKKENILLSLLIPGPKQPGNDIDVYLQPLIEDLNDLWKDGINVYDAFTKSLFNLKVVLLWTINDFPAYGNLAGRTTKGKRACPACGEHTHSIYLKNSKKCVFMGHRRFLPIHHPFRRKKSWFDGSEENERNPRIKSGSDIVADLKDFVNEWGKSEKRKRKNDDGKSEKRKRQNDDGITPMWKKRSIFFKLPYWEALPLRHNLDVMHVEKNVCDSIIGTLLDIKGKSKDGLNARKDLEDMGIRSALHPEIRGARTYLPPAPHTLTKDEKKLFCKRLYDLKVPDGYSSNVGNCVSVEDCKISGMKSHDCHVLMQQLLPVALKGLLPKGPRDAILRLCYFFNKLCQRVIDREELLKLEDEVVETLCLLERFFPPSFFDIMLHLVIHLGREARLCGPVQFRWMYPFERQMKIYKSYVRNRARPEGCIAECYLADESVAFCNSFIDDHIEVDSIGRNEDVGDNCKIEGRVLGQGTEIELSDEIKEIAHRYVLFNTDMVEPYLEMHLEELKETNKALKRNESLLWKKHSEDFVEWFRKKIQAEDIDSDVCNKLRMLANGPTSNAVSYKGIIINGQRFQTKDAEKLTQNSGVMLDASTICRSSVRDNAQVIDIVSYYGVIREIIVLNYHLLEVPLFKCNWATVPNGVKVEEGLTLVNIPESQFNRDPFILASQAKQVFYARESGTSNWSIVLKAPPRGFHDLHEDEDTEDSQLLAQHGSLVQLPNYDLSEECSYVRENCEGSFAD